MKYLIICFFLILTYNLYSQDRNPQIEGVEVSEITLKLNNKAIVKLNEYYDNLANKLGEPHSTVEYYFEMSESNGRKLTYYSNDIYIMNDKFYSFDLCNASFSLGINKTYISVGDDISTLATIYPDYLQLTEVNFTSIPLSHEGILWNKSIVFEFNSRTKEITRIISYEP